MNILMYDFVTYSTRNIFSEGSGLEHFRKTKFSKYVHQTLKYSNYEQCYARVIFVSCNKSFILECWVYISALEHCRKMNTASSDTNF